MYCICIQRSPTGIIRKKKETFDRQIAASVLDVPFQGMVADVDTGKLEGLKENKLRISLTNNTGSDLELGSPSASCGCMSVTLSGKQFPKGETIDLDVHFSPFKNLDSSNQIARINIQTTQGEFVALNLHLQLSAYIGFPQPSSLFEISKNSEKEEIRIPIIITEPFKKEQVQFTTKPEGVLENIRVAETDSGMHVAGTVKNSSEEKKNSIGFEIIAKAKNFPKEINSYCIVEFRSDVTILPRVQRLTKVATQDTTGKTSGFRYEGNALIRIKNDKLVTIKDDNGKESEVKVYVNIKEIDGWRSEITTVRVSKGTYKVTYSLTPATDKKSEIKEVDFDVDTLSDTYELNCPVLMN